MKALFLGCVLLSVAAQLIGQEDREADKKVSDFVLANGIRFVILERHQAPVIAFETYVGGGYVNDPAGQSGLARLVGRLGFKGTEGVGSRNWAEEKKALDAADQAWDRMQSERNKGGRMNQEQFDSYRAQWRLAEDAAKRLGDSGEFGSILKENGVTAVKLGATWHGLQAGYTLPSNRLELWFAMESQRLMHPVLRDFETERSAAIEESTKMQAKGQTRVLDTLLANAFTAHPYRVPSIGWPTDLPELSRRQARAFLEERCVPGNIVVAMAGDVDPAEARKLAEKYFGPMPARPMPPLVRTTEPDQHGPRVIQLDQTGQFIVAIGYKRPSYFDKDDAALDVLQAILGGLGSGGLAQRELVQEKKIAAALQVSAAYPDGRETSLFLFFVAPAPGQTVDQVQRGIDELIGRLSIQKVGLDVLNQAKSQSQSAAYQKLAANGSMAEMLAVHTAQYGDSKKLFTVIDDLGKVSEDDIMRVAQRYFAPAGRTTVYTAFPGMPVRAPRTGGPQ